MRPVQRVGRDLPSLATSALAGVVLAGGALDVRTLVPLGAAVALGCVAGALLHAGRLGDRAIAAWPVGRGALALGLLMLSLAALAVRARWTHSAAPLGAGLMLAASALAAEWWLRGRRARPIAVGVGRALIYLTAAAAVAARPSGEAWAAAAAAGCYAGGAALGVEKKHRTAARRAAGLTLVAVPLAYGALLVRDAAAAVPYGLLLAWVLFTVADGRRASLRRYLAGASLFDALVIASRAAPRVAAVALGGFVLTLVLPQRRR